jgi:uncharacterized membrane protein
VDDDAARTVMAGDAVPYAAPGTPPKVPGRRRDWVPYLIALAVFAAYSVISVSYYVRLDPGSPDLAIFTEAVRQYAHLHAPVADIDSPGLNLLGEHFHPVIALIGPFFRLFPTPVTLLIVQALLTAISVIPVSRAATAVLGTTAGRLVGAAYGFSWGLQCMIDFDFHEVAFAVPLLACSLSAMVRGRPRAAALWAMPLVFVKEDQGFTVAAIGVVMLASAWRGRAGREIAGRVRAGRSDRAERAVGDRAERAGGNRVLALRRTGIFLVVWGLGWSALAITVIIPYFNPWHQYRFWTEGGTLGGGGGNSAAALLSQLAQGGPEKLGTVALLLLPVAFLALRSPLALIGVPTVALRFINTDSAYWGTQYHYNAVLMPVVFIAAIDALARIAASRAMAAGDDAAPPRHRLRESTADAAVRYAPALLAVIAIGLACWGPLRHLVQPQTYSDGGRHVQVEKAAMALVPDGVTVEVPYSMAATLAARADAFWDGDPTDPAGQYIVLDTAPGYDIFDPKPGNAAQWVDRRHPGVSYRQVFAADGIYVFRRE